jgi:hypothetical protein
MNLIRFNLCVNQQQYIITRHAHSCNNLEKNINSKILSIQTYNRLIAMDPVLSIWGIVSCIYYGIAQSKLKPDELEKNERNIYVSTSIRTWITGMILQMCQPPPEIPPLPLQLIINVIPFLREDVSGAGNMPLGTFDEQCSVFTHFKNKVLTAIVEELLKNDKNDLLETFKTNLTNWKITHNNYCNYPDKHGYKWDKQIIDNINKIELNICSANIGEGIPTLLPGIAIKDLEFTCNAQRKINKLEVSLNSLVEVREVFKSSCVLK